LSSLGTMLHRWESLVLPTPKAQCPWTLRQMDRRYLHSGERH